MRTLLTLLTLTAAATASPFSGGACCYDALFRSGTADAPPCGDLRGRVLHSAGHLPRVKARLQSTAWKGKCFAADGAMVNSWALGVRAVRACVVPSVSTCDGAPCFAIDYPPGTPVFGGLRDELRCIAPGVWLGRCTESATGEFKNWFLLGASNLP